MGVRATTSGDVSKMFEKFKRIDSMISSRFQYVGERFIKDARENGDYTDRTGNLRSSIGFIILHKGKTVMETFEKAGTGTDGEAGVEAGRKYAHEIASAFPREHVLIVCAGAEYAAAVEAHGKDVLTGSSVKAKADLSKALQSIADKIK